MPTKKSQQQCDNIKFMHEACYMCDKSICEVKTGAVAVKNGIIITRGFNELLTVSTLTDLPERENVIHAEASLIASAALNGISLEGSTLYVTRFPCLSCARLLYKAGIKKVFYMSDLFTGGNVAKPLLDKLGMPVEQIEESVVWSGS